MVHALMRMLIQYSSLSDCRAVINFFNEKCPADKHFESIGGSRPSLAHTHTPNLAHKLLLFHTLWKSVSKAHCFDSRHMRSRRRVYQLINHLAADDLWSECFCHDKVPELCTFNYRSEGSAYIKMQHPSQLLLICPDMFLCRMCAYRGL